MKKRYVLIKSSGERTEHQTMNEVAKAIGCSRAHIYKSMVDYKITFKKQEYKIIDKIDSYMSESTFKLLMMTIQQLNNN